MANQAIRQEITVCETGTINSSNSIPISSDSTAQLDTSQYSGTPLYYFEFVYSLTVGQTSYSIALQRHGTTTKDVTITSGLSVDGGKHIFRSTSFTPPTGQTEYEIVLLGDGTHTTVVYAGRIIVLQSESAITQTETQIEVGNRITTLSNTVVADITNPKFWTYTAANWDGTKTFYAEVIWTTTAKNTCTITLCRTSDNATNVTIVNAGSNSTGYIRTRVAFTPVNGETYKIRCLGSTTKSGYKIAGARIIVDQISNGSDSNPTGISDNSIGDTSANEAKGQSWTASSAYSLNSVTISLQKIGSPTDNLTMEILSGSITGTVLGTSATVSGSSLPTSVLWLNFTFSSPITISNGTKYYIRVTRSGSLDGTNYYSWKSSGSNTYSGGGSFTRTSGTWGSESTLDDLTFLINGVVNFTKCEPQYLLLNTNDSGTGQQSYLTTYNASEWNYGSGSITFKHAMDSDNASNSCKLTDASSGNTDITSSAVTGSGQQVSTGLTFTDTHNLDVNVTNSTGVIAASRILATYVFVAGAQVYTSSLSATLSLLTAFKYPWKQLSALSFIGVIPKRTAKSAFLAAVSFIGTFLKIPGKFIPAALSFIGTIHNKITAILESALSFIGSVANQTRRILSTALSFIGDIATILSHGGTLYTQGIAAALSFSGSISNQTKKLQTAILSLVGVATKLLSRNVKATLPFNFSTFGFQGDTSPVYEYASGYSGSYQEVAQCFTATRSGNLKSVVFWLAKLGSPTGLAYAKLYNITGTLEVDAVPTGAALTTSLGSDIGAAPLSSTWPTAVQFDFTDNYPIIAGNTYAVSLAFGGGDASNRLGVLSSHFGDKTLPGNTSGYQTSGGWDNGNATAQDTYYGLILEIPFTKRTLKAIADVLSFIGSIVKGRTKVFTAVLSFFGNFIYPWKQIGSLTFSGSIIRYGSKSLLAAVSFIGSIAEIKSFTRLLTATLNFSGAIARFIVHLLPSTASFIGQLNKVTKRILTATVLFIGALLKRGSKLFPGILSFVGSFAHIPGKIFPATISFIGNLPKITGYLISGTLTFIGSIPRFIRYIFGSTASFIGSTFKRTSRLLAGVLSFIGTFIHIPGRLFTAALSFAGVFSKRAGKLAVSILSFIGAMPRAIVHLLPSTLSFIVGTFIYQVGALFAGALNFVGNINRSTQRTSPSTLLFIGNIAKSLQRLWAGTLSFIGNITKNTYRTLTSAILSFIGFLDALKVTGGHLYTLTVEGGLTFIGALLKSFQHLFIAAESFTGTVTKQTGKPQIGSISFIGQRFQFISKVMLASLSFVGQSLRRLFRGLSSSLSYTTTLVRSTFRTMAGTLAFASSFIKVAGKSATGVLSFSGTIAKKIYRIFSGSLLFIGNVSRTLFRSLVSVLSFIGVFSSVKLLVRLLSGALSFTGSIAKRSLKSLQALISFVGDLRRDIAYLLASVVSFLGEQFVVMSRLLTGTLNIIGQLLRPLGKLLTASISFTADISKSIAHGITSTLSFLSDINRSIARALQETLSFIGVLISFLPSEFAMLFESVLDFSSLVITRLPEIIKIGVTSIITGLKISLQSTIQTIKITIKEFTDVFNINP